MNPLEMFQARTRRVFNKLNFLTPLLAQRFLFPYRTYPFLDLPFRRDDKSVGNLCAWLSFWWNPWGSITPSKGGIRLDPHVNDLETALLAGCMFQKNELIGIPWGGAKFCIKEPLPRLNKDERRRAIKAAIGAIKHFIGVKYIPGPDLGTGDLIGVMVDEFAKINPHPWIRPLTVFSGKPRELLGLRIRRESTGLGGLYGLQFLIGETNLTNSIRHLNSSTIVCQGFGQVVQPFAEHAVKYYGARVCAVSDESETLYRYDGIDIELLREAMKTKRYLAETSWDGEHLPPEAIFGLSSDIFVLGARENQLDQKKAKKIQTKLIIELANSPTTPQAEDILECRDIPIIPDIYANGGGVSVSYDELANEDHWSDENLIEKQLKLSMWVAGKYIADTMQKESINRLRDAAILIGLRRAYARYKTRGVDFDE